MHVEILVEPFDGKEYLVVKAGRQLSTLMAQWNDVECRIGVQQVAVSDHGLHEPIELRRCQRAESLAESTKIIAQSHNVFGIVLDGARRVVPGLEIQNELANLRHNGTTVIETCPTDLAGGHDDTL